MIGEGELVGVARPGHRRTVLRHGEHAADELRELVVFRLRAIVEEDLRDPGPVGDVGDRLAIGRPHRVQVLPFLIRDHLDGALLEVEHADAPVAESQRREVGLRSTLADERDVASIRRPLRHQVAVGILGEAREIPPIHVDRVEVGESALRAAERDLAPIRRERRADHLLQRRVEPTDDALAPDVVEIEDVLPLPLRREGKDPSVRREGAL